MNYNSRLLNTPYLWKVIVVNKKNGQIVIEQKARKIKTDFIA